MNVTLLPRAANEAAIYGSKAVGEPPLMLAFSVREAIRDAVAAFGPKGGEVPLASPATSEAVSSAIRRRLAQETAGLGMAQASAP
jgi:xanthine dehydrogenase large subunit